MNTKNMTNERLENHLISLVKSERLIEAEILESLLEAKDRRLHKIQKFKNLATYCEKKLGLTYDQAWLRSKATKTISLAPQTLEFLKNGTTSISCLALTASYITEANKDKIINFLPGRTKAELGFLLLSVDQNGEPVEIDPTVLLQLRFSVKAIKKIERLQGLLVQSRTKSNKEGAIEKAVDIVLEKLDPIKKEERREKRREKVLKKSEVAKPTSKPMPKITGRAIPEAIKAKVFKRDNYQCTEHDIYGERCLEKAVLQIDHIKPWAEGGGHDLGNLTTLCKNHNFQRAEAHYGVQYIENKIKSVLMPRPEIGEAMQEWNGNKAQPRATSPRQMH